MFFEQSLIGSMANFGYVVGDPATKAAAVFDPSFDARVLQKVAEENGYSIGLIFNTHHHVDHVFDNERLANESGGKIAAHRLSNVRKDLVLEDGQIVGVGGLKVKVVHTPGHSPDSCCFIVSGRVFTGDCLFVGDFGRVDLPGSSVEDMYAPLLGRDDEAALGKRVRIVARRILRAAHETLPVGPVADHQLPISALFAAADEVLLADRWTVGRDAITRRPPAVGMFDHGRAAFRAVFLRALDDSDLRQWVGVPTRGVPVAAEEAAPAPGPDDREVPLLADVALPDVVLLPQRRFDFLADRLAVRLERLEDLAEHLLRFADDVLTGPDAGRDSLHVGLEMRRHLRLGDSLRVILQRLDDRPPARRRPWVLAFDEFAIVELLDDLVSRGLRSQSEALHLLDEGPFAVSPRRLRPILPEGDRPQPLEALVYGERG